MTEVREIPTTLGPARAHVDGADNARAQLVLGHGAGGGIESPDLAALAAALPALGVTVVRVEQPWRVAGKRLAPAPARLDQAWREVWQSLRDERVLGPRAVAGGRSAGARVSCRTALSLGAPAVVALAFPLHPPGRPDRSRRLELLEAGLPTLVVQGERDAFGSAEEVRAAVTEEAAETAAGSEGRQGGRGSATPAVAVIEVAGADHALRVGRQAGSAAGGVRESGLSLEIIRAVADFVLAAPAAEGE